MATTPATPTDEQYGIAETATGITIESLTETSSPIGEPIPDQKNATAKEVYVDTRIDIALTYRGKKLTETAGTVGGENAKITFNGKTYYIDSHDSAGSYNGLRRYNLRAHRFDNAPGGSSAS
ncbi:MAG: hypothetical protein ACI4RD_05345 [Kiritimatiellia bacterium]